MSEGLTFIGNGWSGMVETPLGCIPADFFEFYAEPLQRTQEPNPVNVIHVDFSERTYCVIDPFGGAPLLKTIHPRTVDAAGGASHGGTVSHGSDNSHEVTLKCGTIRHENEKTASSFRTDCPGAAPMIHAVIDTLPSEVEP